MFWEKGVLRHFTKFTGKYLCQSLFLNKIAGLDCHFIKKESLAQVLSCEFCEISKNAFSYRTPPVTTSVDSSIFDCLLEFCDKIHIFLTELHLGQHKMYEISQGIY